MNLQYYYNYVTIVEEGSLTAAARKLRIAQPALSNQIKAMEQKYGTRLFFRGARKLELTDAGMILYQKAKRMCEIELAAKNEIASGFSGHRGTLRLGVTSSVSNERFYKVLFDFIHKYPETDVKLLEANPADLLKMLQNGIVEAILIRVPYEVAENFDLLYSQPDNMVALYDKAAGFFANVKKDSITLEQLNDVPLSLVEKSRSGIASAFKSEEVKMNVKCLSTRLQMAMTWARAGAAVALVPEQAVHQLGFDDLSYKKLTDSSITPPRLSLVAQKAKYRSQVINNFMLMLSDEYGMGLDSKIQRVSEEEDDED